MFVRFHGALICACSLLAAPGIASTRTEVWAPYLEPGPDRVGFHVQQDRDFSREYYFPSDSGGAYGPRPRQILFWYPARGGGKPMRFEDYVVLGGEEEPSAHNTAARRAESLAEFRTRPLKNGATETDLNRLLAASMRARREAKPMRGRHPLILYAHNLTFEKSLLCEYLASWGFVVASVPIRGTYEHDLDVGVTGVETEIRDLEDALAAAAGRADVDATRLGVVGMSFGSLTALGFQMRHPSVRAVVSLDGGIGSTTDPTMLQQSPFYASERADAPLLHVYGPGPGADLTYLRGRELAPHWFIGFPGLRHGDFAGYGILEALAPGILGPRSIDVTRSTAWAFRYTRRFLEAFVQGDTASRRFLDGTPRQNGVPDSVAQVECLWVTRPAPPSLEELKQRYRRAGMDSLVALHDQLLRGGVPPGHETYRLLGSWLLDQGDGRDGMRWMQLYLDDYPSSSRAHYFYAAACSRLQQTQEARQHFQRALELLPADPELDPPTRFRLERRATAGLRSLER